MKFDRKDMLSLLAQHQNNIDKKAINPMFASICFASDGENLNISSMDGERVLEQKLNEKLEKFSMFLPGFNFYELLRKSTSKDFEIEEHDENYLINLGSGSFKFAKYAHKAYPNWIDHYENEIVVESQALNMALKCVKWAGSSDESRPFLNGVCLDIANGFINVCATDGLRLALYKIKTESALKGTWILSKKSVNDLIKLLDEATSLVNLKLGNNARIDFKTNLASITWKTLLVAGKFPQYEKIIPTEFSAKLHIQTKEFIEKLERIMIIANLNQPIVTLCLGNQIMLSSESAIASGTEFLEAQYQGVEMRISFNARLLIEMLYNMDGNLEIGLNTPHSPVLIKKVQDQNAIFILAPVKRD